MIPKILNQKEKRALTEVATRLGTRPEWLKDLIRFETAGTYSTTIKNPRSSARGLIQFIDRTARSLGYADSLNLVMRHQSFESQLKGPVYEYLKQYAPFPTEHSLYMAVFYPAARNYPADTPFKKIFSDRGAPSSGPGSYAQFIAQNPGILSPAHYVAKLKGVAVKRAFVISGGVIVALALGGLLWLKMRR